MPKESNKKLDEKTGSGQMQHGVSLPPIVEADNDSNAIVYSVAPRCTGKGCNGRLIAVEQGDNFPFYAAENVIVVPMDCENPDCNEQYTFHLDMAN